jgi:hypothetical protein
LDFLGDRLTCFEEISLTKGDSLRAVVKTYTGFPLDLGVQLELKEKLLSVYTRLSLATEILNRFLAEFNTYIVKPQRLETQFSYRGEIKDFLKRAFWNYSQTLRVFSAYAYKPLELYITLALERGIFTGLLGVAEAQGNAVFGSLTLNINALSGKKEITADLEDFPLHLFIPDFLSGYLNLSLKGRVEQKPRFWDIDASLSFGGFLKLLSYRPPAAGDEKGSPPKGLKFRLHLFTGEPLYVETPNGNLVISLRGEITESKRNLEVLLNYGRLQMLGKTFYTSAGEIKVKDDRVSLDLPLTHYSPDRTVYLRIYGSLPWENLNLEIYSVPPAPKGQLLAELLSGGGGQGLADFPLAKVLLQTGATAVTGFLENFSSSLIKGVKIKFSPSFDPQTGFAVGVDIEKDFSDFARVGYHWFPSPNPKTTYLWGAFKFFGGAFLRLTRFSDGSNSLALRFAKELGFPF